MVRLAETFLLILVLCGGAWGHPGRTDAKGGHYDRKTGTYHYHSTPRKSEPGISPAPGESKPTKPASEPSGAWTSPPADKDERPQYESKFTENELRDAFNQLVTKGITSIETPTGTIDILAGDLAIKVCRICKYRQGATQALLYSKDVTKKPGLALYKDGQEDTQQELSEARILCKDAGIKLWFINEHVTVDYLVKQRATASKVSSETPHASSPNIESPTEKPDNNVERKYWLNTDSDIRHNRGCRWFNNTQDGRFCTANEGKACGLCGG